MRKLTEHSDFVAVAVIALVLGVLQAPVMHVVTMIDMEKRDVQRRVLQAKPLVRVIHFFR